MNGIVPLIYPELILAGVACVLMLLGVVPRVGARRAAAVLTVVTLLAVFAIQAMREGQASLTDADAGGAVRLNEFGYFIRLLTAGVGVLLTLLAWPTNRDATGNNASNFGEESGEFFGLMLLSICGVFLVASANDMVLFFLGLELASLPAYVMVSISRPVPAAQEAGVKYFFLGAMSAALMLFGFSYLYGTTGTTNLFEIARRLHAAAGNAEGATHLSAWQTLAVVMLIAGFAFKLAAFPLHFYAADVYQGAATPVTAFLSFIPKTSGLVALIKLLFIIGGAGFIVPWPIVKLLWAMAALTMTVGNVLGLLQSNVKRVFAYSSIAHSGYMLVGVVALVLSRGELAVVGRERALQGILFYLAGYGITNVAAFGVLTLLPAREKSPASSAETFDDLAGQGRAHPALGLAMAVSCFSLIGIPLTVGFMGKLMLIRPALDVASYWLVIIMMINAAISAAYYLKIVGALFLRAEAGGVAGRDEHGEEDLSMAHQNSVMESRGRSGRRMMLAGGMNLPITIAIALSCAGTLFFGAMLPATQILTSRASQATVIDDHPETPGMAMDTPTGGVAQSK